MSQLMKIKNTKRNKFEENDRLFDEQFRFEFYNFYNTNVLVFVFSHFE